MTERDRFLNMAQSGHLNTHDPKAYRTFLKQASGSNEYAKGLLQRELKADLEVGQAERTTEDMYISANDKAARTVDGFADTVTLGAHQNLQNAYEKGSHGNLPGVAREMRLAVFNVTGAAVAGRCGINILTAPMRLVMHNPSAASESLLRAAAVNPALPRL